MTVIPLILVPCITPPVIVEPLMVPVTVASCKTTKLLTDAWSLTTRPEVLVKLETLSVPLIAVLPLIVPPVRGR